MPRRVTEWQEESSAVSGPLLVATGYHASWRGFFRDNFRRRRTYQWEGGEHGLDLVLGEAGREQPGDQKTSPSWAKWTNVHLHWQGHTQMAAKFTKSSAPPPKVNLTGKLDPSQQAQLLGQAGVQTDPAAAQQPNEVEQEQRLYGPQGEAVIKTKRRL